MATTSGTTYGQKATYTCNDGYARSGNSEVTCEATGSWSGSEPTCTISEYLHGLGRAGPLLRLVLEQGAGPVSLFGKKDQGANP